MTRDRMHPQPTPMTLPEVRRANLDLVTGVLRAADITFFLVRTLESDPYRVGILDRDRKAAAAALARAAAERNLWVEAGREEMHAGALRHDVSQPWRLFVPMTSEDGSVTFGTKTGCEIEDWGVGADGTYIATIRNLFASVIPPEETEPATLEIGGVAYPSLHAFTLPWAHVHPFPIDLAITWMPANEDARSEEELRYCIRSVAMYADWIRKIFVVTANGSPEWLNTSHPKVRVVSHGSLVASSGQDRSTVQAFEARLHHIEGIAEHYVAMSDDVFFGRPVTPDHFFFLDGSTKFFPSKEQIPLGDPTHEDTPDIRAAKNGRRLILDTFGSLVTQRVRPPHPQRRSILLELEERYPDLVDISAASLFPWYAYASARALPARIASRDLVVTRMGDLARLRRGSLEVFRLSSRDPRKRLEFLARALPIKSPFER